MLIRYKKSYEKIAMGLLSYMPEDRTAKELMEIIHQYETDEDWHLFLWRTGEDLLGLIGVEIDGSQCIVHHLSISPSHRNEGIGTSLVEKARKLYPDKEIGSSKETRTFIERYKKESA